MCILINSGIDWKNKRDVLAVDIIGKLNGRNLTDIPEFGTFVNKVIEEKEYNKACYYGAYLNKESFIKSFFRVETSLHCSVVLTLPLCLNRWDIKNNSDLWLEYCTCLDILVDNKFQELESIGNYTI